MAKGNEIVVSVEAKGRYSEGTVSGTLKPGTLVQMDESAGLDANGRPTWEAYNRDADGNRALVAVLLPDTLQGRPATTAYADGEHCFVYFPLPGDELNCLISDVTGTGDSHAFGETLIIDDGTGKLIATTGTPESEPFQLMEALAALTADQLAHVIFTGY